MQFRDKSPIIIASCSLVAAVWSPLAWLAFLDSFPRGWNPGFEHTPWTQFEGQFGLSVILFLPCGFFSKLIPNHEAVGFAIGGAIEGVVVGIILSVIALLFSQRRNATEVRT